MEIASLEKAYERAKDQLLKADEVRASVNEFILTQLRDCFVAGQPRLIILPTTPWFTVPVLLSYPERILGEVGEVAVHAVTGEILGSTPPSEIACHAAQLRNSH